MTPASSRTERAESVVQVLILLFVAGMRRRRVFHPRPRLDDAQRPGWHRLLVRLG